MKPTQYLAGSAAILLVVGGLFVFDRSPPVVYRSGSVHPEQVSPGQPLAVKIVLDWKRLCDLDVSRILRDGAGEEHKLPWSKSSPPPTLPPGPMISTREIIVPATAKYGDKACYRATVYMTCGPFDKIAPIKIEIPCIPFKIVPK